MRRLILILALAGNARAFCPASYTAQRSITVNSAQVTGTLSGFPMLVLNPTSGQANPNNLKTTGNGGRVTNSNGYDITFYTAGGSAIPFELAGHGQAYTTYAAASGNAEFYVNVASIATGSVIYMCYGNSGITTYQGDDATTWSNASGVGTWHFPDNTTLLDSTGGTAMTPTATPTQVTGQIGNALGLNGTTQYASNTSSILPNLTTHFLISAWAFPTSTSAGAHDVFANGTALSFRIQLRRDAANWSCYILDTISSFQSAIATSAVTANAWQHVACNWDGSSMNLYVNGAKVATTSCSATFASTTPNVNSWGVDLPDAGPINFWDGRLDEGRIYSSSKSDAWVTAEYNNTLAPGSFYAVGSETAPTNVSFSISPILLPASNAADIIVSLSGTNTSWSGSTVITASGVSGTSCGSVSVASATAATITCTTGATTGTLTLTETITGSAVATVPVSGGIRAFVGGA